MFLAQLAVVFVGVTGNHHEAVEHQLAPALEKAGVTEMVLPEAELGAIVKHARTSKELVKKLHVGGLVAGALVGNGNARSFKVVLYDADGNLSSETETPISAKGLAQVDIEVFVSNLAEFGGSTRAAAKPAPAKSRAPLEDAAPAHAAGPADDDAPPGMPAARAAAPKTVAAASPDDDAVATSSTSVEKSATPSHGGAIHLRAELTAGVVGRSLASDPGTVQAYTSSPVPSGGFAAAIGFGARASLAGSYEHTLTMHSDVGGQDVSTSIGRWELAAAYDVVHGGVELAPVVGIGARTFAIDTMATARTPDTAYTYLTLGAMLRKPLGERVALRGSLAFQPVLSSSQPTMLGYASRWGFDAGAALELRASAHLFAQAAFDYQSFSSSWNMTGAATDAYPTGTLSLGAFF